MEKGVARQILDIVKTVVIAILISMVSVLVFALVVKSTDVGEDVIGYVNLAIKILSVVIGCLVGFRRGSGFGWLKGVISGLLYVVTSFLVFSAISGEFSLADVSVLDLVTGAVVGLLSGVLTVNLKKSPKNA
ncbi:MAG: TIGR04086 family membrane protein [Clostridia bacterium]|nr:TIGR04086 family membrane protein [Clostridia bacterium]